MYPRYFPFHTFIVFESQNNPLQNPSFCNHCCLLFLRLKLLNAHGCCCCPCPHILLVMMTLLVISSYDSTYIGGNNPLTIYVWAICVKNQCQDQQSPQFYFQLVTLYWWTQIYQKWSWYNDRYFSKVIELLTVLLYYIKIFLKSDMKVLS